jgi:hypothetical protein
LLENCSFLTRVASCWPGALFTAVSIAAARPRNLFRLRSPLAFGTNGDHVSDVKADRAHRRGVKVLFVFRNRADLPLTIKLKKRHNRAVFMQSRHSSRRRVLNQTAGGKRSSCAFPFQLTNQSSGGILLRSSNRPLLPLSKWFCSRTPKTFLRAVGD